MWRNRKKGVIIVQGEGGEWLKTGSAEVRSAGWRAVVKTLVFTLGEIGIWEVLSRGTQPYSSLWMHVENRD